MLSSFTPKIHCMHFTSHETKQFFLMMFNVSLTEFIWQMAQSKLNVKLKYTNRGVRSFYSRAFKPFKSLNLDLNYFTLRSTCPQPA